MTINQIKCYSTSNRDAVLIRRDSKERFYWASGDSIRRIALYVRFHSDQWFVRPFSNDRPGWVATLRPPTEPEPVLDAEEETR